MIDLLCCCLRRNAQVHLQEDPDSSEKEKIHHAYEKSYFKDAGFHAVLKNVHLVEDSTSAQIYQSVQAINKFLLESSKINQIRRAMPFLRKEYREFLSQEIEGEGSIRMTHLEYLEEMIQKGDEPKDWKDLLFYLWVIAVDKYIPMASKREIINHNVKHNKYGLLDVFYAASTGLTIPILQCLSPIQESWDPSVRAVKKYAEESRLFTSNYEGKHFSKGQLPRIKEEQQSVDSEELELHNLDYEAQRFFPIEVEPSSLNGSYMTY